MTVIRCDVHGLLLLTDGYVFRPIRSPHSYAIEHNPELNSRIDGTSAFAVGEKVRARHLGGTPFAKVVRDGKRETWHSHGCYFGEGGKQIPTAECWDPRDPPSTDP